MSSLARSRSRQWCYFCSAQSLQRSNLKEPPDWQLRKPFAWSDAFWMLTEEFATSNGMKKPVKTFLACKVSNHVKIITVKNSKNFRQRPSSPWTGSLATPRRESCSIEDFLPEKTQRRCSRTSSSPKDTEARGSDSADQMLWRHGIAMNKWDSSLDETTSTSRKERIPGFKSMCLVSRHFREALENRPIRNNKSEPNEAKFVTLILKISSRSLVYMTPNIYYGRDKISFLSFMSFIQTAFHCIGVKENAAMSLFHFIKGKVPVAALSSFLF